MKNFFIRLFIYLFVFSIWSHFRLDGFNLVKVKVGNVNAVSSTEREFKDIKSILSQKFIYLNKGHQCFVFVSEDDQYVIKLLNHQRFDLPWQVKFFSFIPYIKELHLKRRLRKEPSYESYRIAYHFLKEETGILYVKMNNENGFHHLINLRDKANNEHKIDLYDVDLVLQKKANPIYPYLENLYKTNKTAFKRAINSFLDVVSTRIRKNIIDDDLDVKINYGFLKEKAILLDPGRLGIDNSLFSSHKQKTELLKSTKKLREWIDTNYPDMSSCFSELISQKINLNEIIK